MPLRAKEEKKKKTARKKLWKMLVWILQPSEKVVRLHFFQLIYMKLEYPVVRSAMHCFLGLKEINSWICHWDLLCNRQSQNDGETKTLSMCRPTSPHCPLVVAHLVASVYWHDWAGSWEPPGCPGGMATKNEVTANILQFYLFVCTSPLSHDLVFSNFLSTSPLGC